MIVICNALKALCVPALSKQVLFQLHLRSIPGTMEEIMKKRQKEADDAYEAMWDGGRGSHHPDYDPYAFGDSVVKASRETEELYNAIVKNDIKKVYKKIEEGADVNFVFGAAYRCMEGYTPLMVAAHRCAAALASGARSMVPISCLRINHMQE